MRRISMLVAALALVAGALGANPVQAQAVDVAWAQPFMGSWNITLETPDGAMPMVVSVREAEGSVQVVLGQGGGEQPISDVKRSNDALVAAYDLTYQGMPINAVITLRRDGDALETAWSFADGMYETRATGTKR